MFQDVIVTVVESVILGVVAFILGYLLKQYLAEKQMKSAQIGAEQTLEDAKAQQREMLLLLAANAPAQRAQRQQFAEEQLRRLCAARGLDWDALSADEREAFIDDLIHEDRTCAS